DVDVIDALGEIPQEHAGVHALPQQVAGVEVEAQGRPLPDLLQQALGAVVVEGDLGGMHLQGQAHAALVVYVEDGGPQFHDAPEYRVHHFRGGLGEGVPLGPYGGAQEAGDHLDVQQLGGLGGGLHALDGPGADGVGLALDGVGDEVVQAGVVLV